MADLSIVKGGVIPAIRRSVELRTQTVSERCPSGSSWQWCAEECSRSTQRVQQLPSYRISHHNITTTRQKKRFISLLRHSVHTPGTRPARRILGSVHVRIFSHTGAG